MIALERSKFTNAPDGRGLRGSANIDGRHVEVSVMNWADDIDEAWANATRILQFFASHFPEIEAMVRRDLERDLEPDDFRDAIAALRVGKIGALIYDLGASSLYFQPQNPDALGAHSLEVQFDEKGQYFGASLAG